MDIAETVRRELECCGDVMSIGESECGNPILCVHRGSVCGRQIIVTAGIHARECYTATVVLEQARVFDGRNCGAYFIPLVNPDGALFFERGETFGRRLTTELYALRREWKSNADGVDLNTNFDARWGSGEKNVGHAGASDFIGERPLCAAESRALAEFTLAVRPAATVSYHCMGGELYWEFFQTGERRKRDRAFADALANHIGVKRVDGHLNSAGGYKDWCVERLGIPAVTIELLERGEHPFDKEDFTEEVIKNADLPKIAFAALDAYDDKNRR